MITGVLAFSGCDYFGRSHAILFLLERVKLYLLAWCCPKVIENDLLLLQPVHSDDFYDCFRTLHTIQDATYTFAGYCYSENILEMVQISSSLVSCHFSDWTKGGSFDVIFLPSYTPCLSFLISSQVLSILDVVWVLSGCTKSELFLYSLYMQLLLDFYCLPVLAFEGGVSIIPNTVTVTHLDSFR